MSKYSFTEDFVNSQGVVVGRTTYIIPNYKVKEIEDDVLQEFSKWFDSEFLGELMSGYIISKYEMSEFVKQFIKSKRK